MTVGPLLEALEHRFEVPAHFATYFVHGEKSWHRLRKVHSGDQQHAGRLFTSMLVIDYDRPKINEKKDPWGSQEEIDELLILLEEADLWPAVSYVTRHGMRFIYVLSEPVPVTESEHLYRILLSRLASIGIESDDQTKDWTHVFALPFITTGDWEPTGGTRSDGLPETRFAPTAWSWENPLVADSLIVTETAQMDVRALRSQRQQPNLIEIHDDRPTAKEAQTLLFGDSGKQTEFYKKAKTLLKNNAFVDVIFSDSPAPFPPGERNTSIFRMVGSLTMRLWNRIEGMTPQHVYALMESCLRGLEEDSCEVMWEQLCRTWEKFHNDEEIQRVSDEDTRAHMLEGFREQVTRSGASLARLAQRLEETEQQFMQRHLILISNRRLYLMNATGNYRTSPTNRDGLVTAILGLGLGSIYGINATDGSEVPLDQVLRRCCSSLDRIDGRLGLKRNSGMLSGFADGDLVLTLPTYYRREDIPAEFVAEVDTYFRKLAGENFERLMDWLGHAQNIHRPICALSISAPFSTGKTFLGDMLAACFGPGGKNTESVMTGTWNDGLMRNPVIHADEGLTEKTKVKRIDQMIRLTVTGGATEIRQRSTDARTAEVYPRMLITANDLDALHTALGKRVLEDDSREALMVRMLHIQAQPEAAVYLKSKGGRDFTNDWIQGECKALKHLAWVFENRDQPSKFKGDGRLLVSGSSDQYGDSGADTLEAALDESPLRAILLASLCLAVEKLAMGQNQICVEIVNGRMETTAHKLASFMEFNHFGQKMPTQYEVSRSMRSIATRPPGKKKGVRNWRVKLDALRDFAEENGYSEKVLDKIFQLRVAESKIAK